MHTLNDFSAGMVAESFAAVAAVCSPETSFLSLVSLDAPLLAFFVLALSSLSVSFMSSSPSSAPSSSVSVPNTSVTVCGIFPNTSSANCKNCIAFSSLLGRKFLCTSNAILMHTSAFFSFSSLKGVSVHSNN